MRYTVNSILLVLLIAVSASAVVLQPGPAIGKDTYISSSAPGVNYGNQSLMYVGIFGGTTLQTLIHFVEVDNYIGYTVESATLSLYYKVTYYVSEADLYMAKITEDWIEYGDDSVTWNNCPDYETTFYTYDYPESTVGAWSDFDVTEIVSDWLDETSANFGLILYTDDNRSHNAYASTCEYTEPNFRPKLEIIFDTGIESASLGGIKAAFK